MTTLSNRAEAVLQQAMSLTPGEQAEVAKRIWEALVHTDDHEPVPDWHLAILKDRLAEPDDDSRTCSAEEVWADLEETINRVRTGK